MPTLLLATRNTGKIRELSALLSDLPLQIESLASHPEVGEVTEDAPSYLGNASAKAAAAACACHLPALADDSGLEVDALGGRPGLHSARYSGGGAEANVQRLLRELRGVPPERRTARFRCVIAVALPAGEILSAEGTCEGSIAVEPLGGEGFGYDPIFVDPATGRTYAELPAGAKHLISHRARACAALRPRLLEFIRQDH